MQHPIRALRVTSDRSGSHTHGEVEIRPTRGNADLLGMIARRARTLMSVQANFGIATLRAENTGAGALALSAGPMSTGMECRVFEVSPGEWFYLLQRDHPTRLRQCWPDARIKAPTVLQRCAKGAGLPATTPSADLPAGVVCRVFFNFTFEGNSHERSRPRRRDTAPRRTGCAVFEDLLSSCQAQQAGDLAGA